jgi:hypothetical protein
MTGHLESNDSKSNSDETLEIPAFMRPGERSKRIRCGTYFMGALTPSNKASGLISDSSDQAELTQDSSSTKST